MVSVYEDNVVICLAVASEPLEPRVVGQYLEGIEENSLAGQDALDQMIQQHSVSIEHTSLTGLNLANMMEIRHQLEMIGLKMHLRVADEMPEMPEQAGGGGAIEPERVRIVTDSPDYENPLAQRWLADSVHFDDGLHGYANYGLREGFALMFLGDYVRHRHRTQAFEVLDQDRLRNAMQRFVEYKREHDETEPTQHWENQLVLMLDRCSQDALLTLRPTRLERERFEADEELGIPAKAEEFEDHMKETGEFTILIVDPNTNEPIEITVPIEDN